jgi:hypothetical protein
MDTRALLRYILSPWVLVGSALVGFGLFCTLLVMVWASRPGPSAPPATAVMQVIPLPSPTPTAVIPTATSTPEQLPPPPPGELALGAYVQVTGTGGDGLRMRSEAGLSGEVRFLGLESEIFLVSDGPKQVDGYTWWFLVAPFDENIRGWAVSNFLAVVQQP